MQWFGKAFKLPTSIKASPTVEPRITSPAIGLGVAIKSIPVPKSINKKQPNALKCATWNIRRGLIKREIELTDLLRSENLDTIFLTETDIKGISKDEDYLIQGYNQHNSVSRLHC